MSDLIDRENAKDKFCEHCDEYVLCGRNVCREECELMDLLNKVKAVEAEPVRHGRWIDSGYVKRCSQLIRGKLIDVPAKMFSCSECGMTLFHMKRPYCPYCGAKMDKKEYCD